MVDRKSVAILVQTSTSWGREVVTGIAEYVQEHGPWIVFIEPRGLHERLLVPDSWRGDGIIARVDHPELEAQIATLGIPAVNVSWSGVRPDVMPSVRVNDLACGRSAGEHLLDSGLRRFAYVPQPGRPGYMNERLYEGFAQIVQERGFEARAYEGELDGARDWTASVDELAAWLKGFGEPVGVLAFGDAEARLVVQACTVAGLRVPEDVAVVGSEQDPLMSALCGLGISTVNLNGQSVGYRAAEILDGMMRGQAPAERVSMIEPAGVVGRESTDGTAVSDPLVRDALVRIREQISEPIRVKELAESLGVARRTLESRFRSAIGRSPGEAIRRLRVEKAARLLADTHLSLSKVAELCGYAEPRLLTAHFRSIHGMTPTAFRKARRHGSEEGDELLSDEGRAPASPVTRDGIEPPMVETSGMRAPRPASQG